MMQQKNATEYEIAASVVAEALRAIVAADGRVQADTTKAALGASPRAASGDVRGDYAFLSTDGTTGISRSA